MFNPDQDDSLILKNVHGVLNPTLTNPSLTAKARHSVQRWVLHLEVQCIRTQTGYYISETPVFNHMTLGKSFAQSGLQLFDEGAGLERN